jgi:hypothetical protein
MRRAQKRSQDGRIQLSRTGEGDMPKPPAGVFKRKAKNGKTRYSVRVYDSGAKGNQRWVGTYDSVQEATTAKNAAMADRGLSGSLTVADWSVRWLTECPRGEGTTRAYRYATSPLVDRFGERQIRTITEAEGNRFMVSSPKNAGDAARVMFSDARRLGLIARNPFEGAPAHFAADAEADPSGSRGSRQVAPGVRGCSRDGLRNSLWIHDRGRRLVGRATW